MQLHDVRGSAALVQPSEQRGRAVGGVWLASHACSAGLLEGEASATAESALGSATGTERRMMRLFRAALISDTCTAASAQICWAFLEPLESLSGPLDSSQFTGSHCS